jgi:hypothetical protein
LSIHQGINNIAIDSRNNLVYVHTSDASNVYNGFILGYRFEDSLFHSIKNFTGSSSLNPYPLLFALEEGELPTSEDILTDTYNNITFSTDYDDAVDIEYNDIKDLAYVLATHNLYVVDFIAGTANNITRIDSIFVSNLPILIQIRFPL